ncbi:ATP-dependent helicase [Rhodococcus sp. IEGM1300]
MITIEQSVSSLNKQQKEAALHLFGPCLVIAGAGSGKTRVLTVRISYLLDIGTDPSRLFVSTFTNKAAKEMKERLSLMVGETLASKVWMGTFHSLCIRILRAGAGFLGYGVKDHRSDFLVMDQDESKSVKCAILKRHRFQDTDLRDFDNFLSNMKSKLISPDEAYRHCETPVWADMYKEYQEYLLSENLMDFDDIIVNTVRFLEMPQGARWRNRFEYCMTDEFQDTNPAQLRLLTLLASNGNFYGVGDDCQSIYSFRQADMKIMLNLHEVYPSLRTIILEQNYRSTSNIVNVGNAIVSNNIDRLEKVCQTPREDGEKIIIKGLDTDIEEAVYIASKIHYNHTVNNVPLEENYILYRAGYLTATMEQALQRMNIPYHIHKGTAFKDREEVKDMLYWLRMLYRPDDIEALLRVINKPTRGIGDRTIEEIRDHAKKHQVSLSYVLTHLDDTSLKARAKKSIQGFVSLRNMIAEDIPKMQPDKAIYMIAERSGLWDYYKGIDDKEDSDRIENIQELASIVRQYLNENPNATLETFVQDSAMFHEEGSEPMFGVQLMTIHASKGLEAPHVYIMGCNEGIFPSARSVTREQMEEERRLFYVAVTRAEETVTLTYSYKRSGRGGARTYEESRFLDEIPEHFVEYH